jgi:putative membrane-bound dehydrogenase-like protein
MSARAFSGWCGVLVVAATGWIHSAPLAAQDDVPRVLDSRVKIELFAENPQIMTPTGIDVDSRGRVFALESNTHFPPADYPGPKSDRLLVFPTSPAGGRAEMAVLFADGFRHAMSVLVAPPWLRTQAGLAVDAPAEAAAVYVATRRSIWRLHDDTGDGVADRREELVKLETKGDYPHNGLAGFALDGTDWLYFGFGENLGEAYAIVGVDGTRLAGGGEGGNIYRCRLDGTRLQQISTGFWNPHANCVDAFGRVFSVDNDPDSRPPCRLLHVVPGSDFGYRFRNGRKGLHPFTAWDGELPGTLPMVAGTGEAPSGVLANEGHALPDDFQGDLFATSWGDHRIDRFVLKPRGASYQSLAVPLVVGGANFRPVGLAQAPDGSLYCTDWVLQDYNLHQKGRIWRITGTAPMREPAVDLQSVPAASAEQLHDWLAHPRLPLRRAAARQLAQSDSGRLTLRTVLEATDSAPRARHEALWALLATRETSALPEATVAALLRPGQGLERAVCEQLGTPQVPAPAHTPKSVVQGLINDRLATGGRPQGDPSALVAALAHAKLEDPNWPAQIASIDDPYVFASLIDLLARELTVDRLADFLNTDSTRRSPALRLAALLAARRVAPRDETLAGLGLADRDPRVRQAAVQWVAEEKLAGLRETVERVFQAKDVTSGLFVASLAALAMLDGRNPAEIDKLPPAQYVVPLATDPQRPASVRVQALRLVSPTDPALTPALFNSLWATADKGLQVEALRSWQGGKTSEIAERLLRLPQDAEVDRSLRLEAILILSDLAAREAAGGPTRTLLARLLSNDDVQISIEALRALRGVNQPDEALKAALAKLTEQLSRTSGEPSELVREQAAQVALLSDLWKLPVAASLKPLLETRPTTKEEWVYALGRGRGGDPEAGRRAFFHPSGAGCLKCHTMQGRGGRVGPDLSRVTDTMNRMQMVLSLLEPSAEIAPQFVAWTMELRDGRQHTGMIVHENEGKTVLGDAEGKTVTLPTAEIVERIPQKTSVMPAQLYDRMTLQEVRDMLAYLVKGSR